MTQKKVASPSTGRPNRGFDSPDGGQPLLGENDRLGKMLNEAHDTIEWLSNKLSIERAFSKCEKGWRCFHCNAVFLDPDEARAHFGRSGDVTQCVDRLNLQLCGCEDVARQITDDPALIPEITKALQGAVDLGFRIAGGSLKRES